MNRPELVKEAAAKLRIGRVHVSNALDAILETIIETVASGEEVKILDFGKFEAVKKSSRLGVNPKTGERIDIPEKIVVKFTPGKEFREAVVE